MGGERRRTAAGRPAGGDRLRAWLRAMLGILSAICALLAVVFLVVNWDPTRVYYKRWLADDPYHYDEIAPAYRDFDPAAHIRIHAAADARRVRDALITAIWGRPELPLGRRPASAEVLYPADAGTPPTAAGCEPEPERTHVRVRCVLDRYTGIDNLARIEQLRIPVDGFTAVVTGFHPRQGNGRLILFHNGFASTINRHYRHIETWLSRGYGVLGFNLPGYGETAAVALPYETTALRVFVEPVVVGVNDALARGGYDGVDMVGFSAGGWVSVVAAAVDDRIRRSYPVTASLPAALRRERETARPQVRAELLAAAGYLDMYVLGAAGAGRRQVQIFNRYDTCCFAGTRPLLYEAAVREAVAALGAGSFAVVLDETHPRHKISRYAMELILADLARP